MLTPLRVRSLAAFVRALGPIRDRLAEQDCDLWQLIADDGEALTAALAIAADVPLDVVDGMEPGELMADRKSTRLNSSHIQKSRMPSSA